MACRDVRLWALSLVAAGALLATGRRAAAQAPLPAGPEFLVNVHTTGDQLPLGIAVEPDGDFVIVWTSYDGQDGNGSATVVRRFGADGTPRGGEILVNTYTTGDQTWPGIAVGDDGAFDVVWTSEQDGSGTSIHGQRFDPAGARVGGEFQVNTYTTGYQFQPKIARAADGRFVVAWTGPDGSGDGSRVRRYDAAGNAIGVEFAANAYTSAHQWDVMLSGDAAGGFVVVWRDQAPRDGSGWSVYGQRFDPAGNRSGSDFRVNAYTTGDQFLPGVSVRPTGEFAVAFGSRTGDGSLEAVMARTYDAAGNALGSDFVVNSYTTGVQYGVGQQIDHDASGAFVVTWVNRPDFPTDTGDVSARRFDAGGTAVGDEFTVNQHTTGGQQLPVVGMAANGDFVIAWLDRSGADGSGMGVFARRYHAATLVPAALAVDPSATSTSNGNGVHEPGEEVAVHPSWRNVGAAAQTVTAALSGAAGPPGGTYTITDASGDYGVIAPGASVSCLDCYALNVSDAQPRPAAHWDVTAVESAGLPAAGRTTWLVHLGRSFDDVAVASPFYRFVETLYHHSITGACGPATYCPLASTTREQMAVFVLTGRHGAGYVPPTCGATPVFADVPPSSPFCRWVEELARRGVVSGCGGGNYCPQSPVSREQMAVFVLRTLDLALSPPACGTPLFTDVPAASPFCRWIEELARRGVVTGCGGGSYCPALAVTREQMGVFISVTFGLTLYGP